MIQKKISVLGSTGSIGRSTLEIVEESSLPLEVVGLAAGRNLNLLKEQIGKFKPRMVSCTLERDADELRNSLSGHDVSVSFGAEGAEKIARMPENDIVVSAITGISGLQPTMAALEAGKTVALANKESMVVAGGLIRRVMDRTGARLIPVDSEHSGVFQCLAGEDPTHVRKVMLTASGGPFFLTPKEKMRDVTLHEALNHPRWKMGRKVTVDSATMMNKGLELIEAKWLFDLEPRQLDMLIHPQSIVHSLVEMRDGSILAQLSQTDMKIPIQYALTYPERGGNLLPSLDLAGIGTLEFHEVDMERFPLAELAIQVLRREESSAVALNSANEVAVEAFLDGEINFIDITDVVTRAVEMHKARRIRDLETIFEIDRETRSSTRNFLEKGS